MNHEFGGHLTSTAYTAP